MNCPNCQRPLWNSFVKALYSPDPEGLPDCCRTCQRKVRVHLPHYLSQTEYTLLGGFVVGISLALLLTIDVDAVLRIQMLLSALILIVGLLGVLTWNGAQLK